MSDPQSRQAAALAAVDRLIEFERWLLLPARPGGTRHRVGVGARRSAAQSLAGLEGRRRILQRHAPVLCRFCPESREHYVCSAHSVRTWEDCEDWRDAAAGLPLDQELAAE